MAEGLNDEGAPAPLNPKARSDIEEALGNAGAETLGDAGVEAPLNPIARGQIEQILAAAGAAPPTNEQVQSFPEQITPGNNIENQPGPEESGRSVEEIMKEYEEYIRAIKEAIQTDNPDLLVPLARLDPKELASLLRYYKAPVYKVDDIPYKADYNQGRSGPPVNLSNEPKKPSLDNLDGVREATGGLFPGGKKDVPGIYKKPFFSGPVQSKPLNPLNPTAQKDINEALDKGGINLPPFGPEPPQNPPAGGPPTPPPSPLK